MRRFNSWLIVVCVFLAGAATLHAQDDGKKAEVQVPCVVVIDIERALHEHVRLRKTLIELNEVESEFETEIQMARQKIETLREEVAQHSTGSPEYLKQEERVVKAEAELAHRIELQNLRAARDRALAYHDAYTEIQRRVAEFAGKHRIHLVINYDSSPIDKGDPAAIMDALKANVVYQESLDITELIIR